MVIFQQGKPVDFFVLILEGRVEVTVGKENLVFDGGPFVHFGLQALGQNVGFDSPQQQQQQAPSQVLGSLQSLNMDALLRHTFIPDYSVRAMTDLVYLVIKRSLYLAAKRATLMEHSKRMGEHSASEPFDDEVEKVKLTFSSFDFHLTLLSFIIQLLHSLDEDDSVAHTNYNSPRVSKPASPISHQTLMPAHSNDGTRLINENDGGLRVAYKNSPTGSSNPSESNAHRLSAELHEDPHEEPESEQPLLTNKTANV